MTVKVKSSYKLSARRNLIANIRFRKAEEEVSSKALHRLMIIELISFYWWGCFIKWPNSRKRHFHSSFNCVIIQKDIYSRSLWQLMWAILSIN